MFWTRNKHLCDKLDDQCNTSRLIEGNDSPCENRLKTLNFPPLYLRKDNFVLLQLLKFVKSDFAANLDDYMSFNKRVIRQRAIVTSVESSTVEPKLMIKKTLFGLDITNWKNLHALIVECNAVCNTKKG